MLVLTRKEGESILIGEGDQQVKLLVGRIDGNRVRLAFSCGKDVGIWREELWLKRRQQQGGMHYGTADGASAGGSGERTVEMGKGADSDNEKPA